MNGRCWILLLTLGFATACGGESAQSCVGDNLFSTAVSGGLCQVNVFSDPERAVYCAQNGNGEYDCACGAAVENPLTFVSPDICDLDHDARVCAAVEACGFTF